MKNNLLNDMRTAAELFRDIRKLRKSGQVVKVEVESAKQVPVFQLGCGFYDTIEGCTLSWCSKEIVEISRQAFYSLSPAEKHLLANTPKDGEFIERALFWRELLKPVMTSKDCHTAMIAIIHWYIHIKKKNSASAAG